MKRLFIATNVHLNPNFLSLYKQLRLRTPFDNIAWIEETNLHLTLRFLGKTPDNQIEPLIDSLTPIFKKQEKIDIELNRIGIFGSRYKPTVIWLGIGDNLPLSLLFEQIEKQIISLGFDKNHGNFVPHVTLGRIKKIDDKKRFNSVIQELQPHFQQIIHVDEWILYRSQLETKGAIYTPLATWKMKENS